MGADEEENIDFQNRGTVKSEIKKIYDNTEQEIKAIFVEREKAIEDVQE